MIKGEGEIIEEAVSYEKHKAINKVYIYNKKYNKVGIMTIIWSIYSIYWKRFNCDIKSAWGCQLIKYSVYMLTANLDDV